jgi:hypothetical protein
VCDGRPRKSRNTPKKQKTGENNSTRKTEKKIRDGWRIRWKNRRISMQYKFYTLSPPFYIYIYIFFSLSLKGDVRLSLSYDFSPAITTHRWSGHPPANNYLPNEEKNKKT